MEGHDVSLVELDSFAESIIPIQDNGGIDVIGAYGEGKAALACITTDIQQGIEARDILIFCVPAYGHEAFMRACIPYLEDGQLLLFIGYFGALRMAEVLKDAGSPRDVVIGELLNCVFVCTKTGPCSVHIKKRKMGLPFATIPSDADVESVRMALRLFPDWKRSQSCLETSINNTSPLIHTTGSICNAGWIESTRGGFQFVNQGVSPAVVKVRTALDVEKQELAKRLGFEPIAYDTLMQAFYAHEEKAPSAVAGGKQAAKNDAPQSLQHRYILEDVKYGLVPMSNIAKVLKVETPTIDAVITLASKMLEESFFDTGPSAVSLGFSGSTPP